MWYHAGSLVSIGATMSIRQSFIDRIYDGVDPFASFTKSKASSDTLPEGWGSTHPYFKQYIDQLKPGLIVEVGTWLGGSAIHMARLLRAARLNESCIICIDTWLGSSEHFMHAEGRSTLKLVNGRATFYDDFMRNVMQHGAAHHPAVLDHQHRRRRSAARMRPRAGSDLSRRRSHRARFSRRPDLYWKLTPRRLPDRR
jgi:hypothetical protein